MTSLHVKSHMLFHTLPTLFLHFSAALLRLYYSSAHSPRSLACVALGACAPRSLVHAPISSVQSLPCPCSSALCFLRSVVLFPCSRLVALFVFRVRVRAYLCLRSSESYCLPLLLNRNTFFSLLNLFGCLALLSFLSRLALLNLMQLWASKLHQALFMWFWSCVFIFLD